MNIGLLAVDSVYPNLAIQGYIQSEADNSTMAKRFGIMG